MKKAGPSRTRARRQQSAAGASRELVLLREERELENHELRETQRVLEQTRDRYARLFDSLPIGLLVLDHLGRIRDLNATAATMLESERALAIGRPLVEYVPAGARRDFFSHLHACRDGSAQVVTEVRLRSREAGPPREVELTSVKPSTEEAYEVLCYTAMADITERKMTARALEESEVKSRWLIENMPVVVWTIDRNGSPRYVSANVQILLGYSEREVRGSGVRFWMRNVHPDDRPLVEAAYARLFDESVRAAEAAFELEYRRQTRDGGWVWVLDKVMSVGEEQERRRYANGMFWDISSRKRMEQRVLESEERFRQLAENIDHVFYLTSADRSELYYVSPAVERVWGLTRDELYRDPSAWQRSIHPDDRPRVERALEGAPRYEVEFRISAADGALRWIRSRGFPIQDGLGRIYRIAGIAEDITQRKEADAAREAAHRTLREFSTHLESAREEERTRISREIHDELGALLLSIKIDLDACRKEHLASAPGTAAAMQNLMDRVDNTIDAVRRIATALRPSVLDNVGVLAAVEWQAQELARRTGVRCEVVSNTGGEELKLDPERATAVFRIVQEALTNVVRHSGASRVSIALRALPRGLAVNIRDNGVGFDAAGAPGVQHWGLIGMAERARALGGQLSVKSAPQRGTTIKVFLPKGNAATR